MRMLVVARWYPSHDSPGRGSFVADQVRALTAAGCEVVVASWEPALLQAGGDPDAAADRWTRTIVSVDQLLTTPSSWGAGVPVARLPAVMPSDPGSRHPVDLARWQARPLVRFGTLLAESWPFDVIHAHTGLPDGLAAIELADRLGLPLLTTEHDGSLDRRLADERSRAAYRSLAGERRRLVAVSPQLADQASALSGLERSAIAVIPNIVDSATFHPDPGIRRDPGELLWVGNRKVTKGMNELLDAFAIVAPTRPAVHLRLIGDAPTPADDEHLRERARDLGIDRRVTFEPAAARPAVAAAMNRASLFVHPSPRESFGIVALEALASGLPVVACAPTIAGFLGSDHALGEIAGGPDAASLADAVNRALDRIASFDEARLSRAAAPFGPTAVAAAILAEFEAMGGTGATGSAEAAAEADGSQYAPPVGGLAPDPPILVVAARRRSALERAARLPADAANSLTILTSTAADSRIPTPPPAWIEMDPEADWRAELAALGGARLRTPLPGRPGRWLAAAVHPRRAIARRRLFARRATMAREARASAVRAAAASLPGNARIVALDSDDLSIIDDARLGSRLEAGSLRWIADRADRRPAMAAEPDPAVPPAMAVGNPAAASGDPEPGQPSPILRP